MHKVREMSIYAATNVNGTDWLMSIFVNEPGSPGPVHVRARAHGQQSKCAAVLNDKGIMV